MKTVSLSGSLRANVGSKDAAVLRAQGQIPCVLYGGESQIHFAADERAFKDIIYTPEACFVNIQIDGKEYRAILQEAQYHKLNDKLIHADFLIVNDQKPISINIPVKTVGTSEGVKAGGKLVLKMRKIKVRGLAKHIPDVVNINIENLAIGKSITVGEVNIEGVEFLSPKNITIVSVNTTRAVAQSEQAGKDDKKGKK